MNAACPYCTDLCGLRYAAVRINMYGAGTASLTSPDRVEGSKSPPSLGVPAEYILQVIFDHGLIPMACPRHLQMERRVVAAARGQSEGAKLQGRTPYRQWFR